MNATLDLRSVASAISALHRMALKLHLFNSTSDSTRKRNKNHTGYGDVVIEHDFVIGVHFQTSQESQIIGFIANKGF